MSAEARLPANTDLSRLIVEGPEIQAGAPTLRGTRILVWPVAKALERGVPEAELLEGYPRLTPEFLPAARLFARTQPLPESPEVDTDGLTPRFVRRIVRPVR